MFSLPSNRWFKGLDNVAVYGEYALPDTFDTNVQPPKKLKKDLDNLVLTIQVLKNPYLNWWL